MKSIFFGIALLLLSPVCLAETATLKLRLAVDERLDSSSYELRDFVVYAVDTRAGRVIAELPKRDAQEHKIYFTGTGFYPRLVAAQRGDTMVLVNQNDKRANLMFIGLNVVPQAIALETQQTFRTALPAVGNVSIALDSISEAVQPGMILHFSHRCAQVAEIDGSVMMTDLPTNVDLTFVVFHPELQISEIQIGERHTQLNKASFSRQLKPGVNQLGTVTVKVHDGQLP